MSYLLYCIFKDQGPLRPETIPGVGGHPVFLVASRGLGAAVSAITRADRSPGLSGLLAYGRVIDAFHRQQTLIPMRYGCFFEESSQIIRLLKDRRPQYEGLLQDLEGCVEMGIRVLWPDQVPSPGGTKAKGASGPGAPPARERSPDRPGRAYLAARREHFAAEEREALRWGRVTEQVCQALSGLFVRCRPEFRVLAGSRLHSLYFLVPRSSLPRFRQAFRQIRGNESGQLLLSGPWPPYNFVLSTPLGYL
jgi:hypothetical protein